MLGSSIPKYAGQAAVSSTVGKDLHLSNELGYHIMWDGRSGMTWDQLEGRLQCKLCCNPPPKFLMIHLGSNDLVPLKGKELIESVKLTILRFNALMPNTTIIWSELLPRLFWFGANKPKKIEKKRKQVNSLISQFVIQQGGKYLRHVNVLPEDKYFRFDGTHLSPLGNAVYLNAMYEGLKQFITTSKSEYISKSLKEGVLNLDDFK